MSLEVDEKDEGVMRATTPCIAGPPKMEFLRNSKYADWGVIPIALMLRRSPDIQDCFP